MFRLYVCAGAKKSKGAAWTAGTSSKSVAQMSKRKQAIAGKLGAKKSSSVVKKSKAAAGKATTLAGKASEAAQRVATAAQGAAATAATTAQGVATAGLQSIQDVSKPL